ncbi:MAG: ABC transporter ATP-binding protein [Candidatus Omnitrophota bacterium]
MGKVLEIQHLSVSFKEKRVLSDVSFSIYSGEIMALVGESGSGKTMTALSILNLLPGSATLEEGRVLFKGENIFDLGADRVRSLRGKDIALVFQEPFTALNPVIRIGDQLKEVIVTHKACPAKETDARIKELFSTVKLVPEAVSLYPHELSGGMRQRAMLAMALSCDPALLILDEPTTALDVSIQKHILDLIKAIQRERKITILYISHDFSVVNYIADRVCVMKEGRIVECGEKEKVLRSPSHEYTRKLIESIPKLGDKRERLPI